MANENPSSSSSLVVRSTLHNLSRAIRGRDEQTVEQLLREADDPASVARGWIRRKDFKEVLTLLMVCAVDGHGGVARSLIRGGCQLDTKTTKGNTALHYAASFNNFDVASELIKSGANVCVKNMKGNTPLDAAIITTTHLIDLDESLTSGCLSGIRQMAYAYAPLNTLYSEKSCGNNYIFRIHDKSDNIVVNFNLVKMLLDAGADVNHKDKSGCSPIQLAVLAGDVELVKILIDAGADLNSKNDIGITALHNAVLCCASDYVYDFDKAIDLLLNHGASVSAKTKHGDTALHWASAFNRGPNRRIVIRKLLEFGSNVNEKNANGKTILDILNEHPSNKKYVTYPFVIEYIAEIEAKTNKPVFDEHNLAVINGDPEMKSHYDKCQAELTAMKNRKIGDTLITYLDVLTEPMEVVASYAKNEDFVKDFNGDGHYENAYPIYKLRLKAKISGDTTTDTHVIVPRPSTTLQLADSSDPAVQIMAQYWSGPGMESFLQSAFARSSSSN